MAAQERMTTWAREPESARTSTAPRRRAERAGVLAAELRRAPAPQQFTALGRTGVPEDIGPMVASLLANDNHGINGQRVEVSGGMWV